MSKIKVALFLAVATDKNFDGVNMTLYTVLNLLPKNEVEFLLVTAKPPKKHSTFPFKYIVEPHLSLPLYKDYPMSFPQLTPKVRKKLDEFKPDIIHITTPFFSGPWALRYAQRRNIPVLTIYHTHFLTYLEYYIGKYKPLYKMFKGMWERHFRTFYNNVDIALIPTTVIKEDLLQLGVKDNKMEVWGRGINLQIFNPQASSKPIESFMAHENKKSILFVSRLVWYKELKTLISVYKQIMSKRSDVIFTVVGDGPQREELEREMPEAVFLGHKNHEELASIYASSDVFIFPSITETFGNVVQEAMACGCPPVVAAAGGPKGIVADGVNGFHAKPKDADDFVRLLTTLLDDFEVHKKLSTNAVTYAQNQSWDNLALRLLNYYKKLV